MQILLLMIKDTFGKDIKQCNEARNKANFKSYIIISKISLSMVHSMTDKRMR